MNCIILKCNHVDVKPGTCGRVVSEIEGGYAIEITGEFILSGPVAKRVVSTETVWCEKDEVKLLDELLDA